MSNGLSASPEPPKRATTRPALAIKPLPLPEPGPDSNPASGRHGHNCLSCGEVYECPGPEEIGYCAPVCQPCYWFELDAQLRIYQEVVTELRRKRIGIERRIGRELCRNAAARRRNSRTDANLMLAFGNVLKTRSAPSSAALSTEAQRGGSHE